MAGTVIVTVTSMLRVVFIDINIEERLRQWAGLLKGVVAVALVTSHLEHATVSSWMYLLARGLG